MARLAHAIRFRCEVVALTRLVTVRLGRALTLHCALAPPVAVASDCTRCSRSGATLKATRRQLFNQTALAPCHKFVGIDDPIAISVQGAEVDCVRGELVFGNGGAIWRYSDPCCLTFSVSHT